MFRNMLEDFRADYTIKGTGSKGQFIDICFQNKTIIRLCTGNFLQRSISFMQFSIVCIEADYFKIRPEDHFPQVPTCSASSVKNNALRRQF